MIIVMKKQVAQEDVLKLMKELTDSYNVQIHEINGSECTVLGVVGDTTAIEIDDIARDARVERAMRVKEPFKKANRAFHPEDSIIEICGRKIGGKDIAIIAGPCSVESESQIIEVAEAVKASGAAFLRGGAYKPRTSPYAFQGLEAEGLELLKLAKKQTGLPIVTEIMDPATLDQFVENVDIIQVGARNMQNFTLLKQLGQTRKPILLKRGLSATIEEWIMAAEYIMAGGNEQVIFCERGIRTFENYTRNTLDLSAIPAIKKLSHLPVIIDPSHATGLRYMVEPLSMAAIAAGADGLIIEVHNNPAKALCDGPQSITPDQFTAIMSKIKKYAAVEDRHISEVK